MHASAGGPVELEAALTNVTSPVRLIFFTQTIGCETFLPAWPIDIQVFVTPT